MILVLHFAARLPPNGRLCSQRSRAGRLQNHLLSATQPITFYTSSIKTFKLPLFIFIFFGQTLILELLGKIHDVGDGHIG